jgi:hypothetical protein
MIVTEGRFQDEIEIVVTYDPASLSETNDPLEHQQSSSYRPGEASRHRYEKSKPKLHGILTFITTKEVDEMLSIHRFHLNANHYRHHHHATNNRGGC